VAEDHFWYWLYLPLVRAADAIARLVGLIQQGRISVYLMYSFFTLLALLFFIR
jgi:hydrogenase-4 component B